MIVTLWNIEDLDDMALQAMCVCETLWDVADGHLTACSFNAVAIWALAFHSIPLNMQRYNV